MSRVSTVLNERVKSSDTGFQDQVIMQDPPNPLRMSANTMLGVHKPFFLV